MSLYCSSGVWFSAPMWGGSHQPLIPAPRDPCPLLTATGACAHTVPTPTHTYMHNLNFFFNCRKPNPILCHCNNVIVHRASGKLYSAHERKQVTKASVWWWNSFSLLTSREALGAPRVPGSTQWIACLRSSRFPVTFDYLKHAKREDSIYLMHLLKAKDRLQGLLALWMT